MTTTPHPATPPRTAAAQSEPAPTRHTVRVRTSDGTTLTLHLPDECALTIDVDGREYVGVLMPTDTAEEVRPVAVVTFDADGEGSTSEPVGYAVPAPASSPVSTLVGGGGPSRVEVGELPCRAWGCECVGDGVVDG